VRLDGVSKSKDGLFERTRFRCVPRDRGEKQHVYLGPMPARRDHSGEHVECPSCERTFQRAEGLAGGYRFRFVVREMALALTRIGEGQSYRRVSRDLRRIIGRVSARGRRRGLTSKDSHLAINYIDLLGARVIEELAPKEWPPIVLLDALPLRIRDHSQCCAPYRAIGMKPPRHDDVWGPPEEEEVEEVDANGQTRKVLRPKVPHTAPIREVGRILVAVGLQHAGDYDPQPVLIRFAGGGDQASWSEFLRVLPGKPEWVVSDRDGAIATAVQEVWRTTTHYLCEQHIAENGSEKAIADGILPSDRSFWTIFEQAQYGVDEWLQLRNLATALGLRSLLAWMIDIEPTMADQWAKRRQFYPRSAGACEAVIRRVGTVLDGRQPFFRNADRLNLLLGLARLEIEGVASVNRYSTIIRGILAANDGRSSGGWFELRDPAGTSSMRDLVAESAIKAKAAKSKRMAPGKAANFRRKRAEYEKERKALGLPPSPRGTPRLLRAQGSVAGKTIADFGWLVAEFHESMNGSLHPADVLAGSGEMIWWRCLAGPDHEWQSQTRSRTLRGTGCPFCAHKKVAPSEALSQTHPDIAAQWHPTRNGNKTPADFTYGSHHEAWWQCPTYKTHVCRARIASRTSMLAGCSLCSRLHGKGGGLRKDAEDNAVA
jgi:hypothetical protein